MCAEITLDCVSTAQLLCAELLATLDYEVVELRKQSRGGDINGTNRYE